MVPAFDDSLSHPPAYRNAVLAGADSGNHPVLGYLPVKTGVGGQYRGKLEDDYRWRKEGP
jgi:hypothetical protein